MADFWPFLAIFGPFSPEMHKCEKRANPWGEISVQNPGTKFFLLLMFFGPLFFAHVGTTEGGPEIAVFRS